MMNLKLTWAEHTTRVATGLGGYPIVEILWEDAKSFGAPDWVEEIETTTCDVTTVGYLVHEDDHVYVVVSLINEVHVGHGTVIPKVAVTGDVRKLR